MKQCFTCITFREMILSFILIKICLTFVIAKKEKKQNSLIFIFYWYWLETLYLLLWIMFRFFLDFIFDIWFVIQIYWNLKILLLWAEGETSAIYFVKLKKNHQVSSYLSIGGSRVQHSF